MIELKNIYKSYSKSNKSDDKNIVLEDVSITFQSSATNAIVGASGSGKSTLLNMIGTVDNPDSGSILYHNLDLASGKIDNKEQFRNKNIGFVFQSHNLLPEFTIYENIVLPSRIAKIPTPTYQSDAKDLMRATGIDHLAKKYPQYISGGESQRAAICRALINNPSIVLADEPTGNLDSLNSENIISLLQDMARDKDITLIIATHSQKLASSADYVYRMVDKKIVPHT